MMKTLVKALAIAVLASPAAFGADKPGELKTLDDLLQKVRADQQQEKKLNKQREAEFLAARNKQKELLAKAKAALKAEEARGVRIKTSYDSNEKELASLEEKLRLTTGTLGELFGVVKQVAGDTKGVFDHSVISAEFPGRAAPIDQLARRKKLPNIDELAGLWLALQKELTESGKVSRFNTKVTTLTGEEIDTKVTRVGSFNLVGNGEYLRWLPEVGKVAELGRQPQGRYLDLVADFEDQKSGMAPLAIDPSRGTILSLLVQAPSLVERIQQGGVVGYVILCILLLGLGIASERFTVLSGVSRKVKDQMASGKVDADNPLGQIFSVYQENKDKDLESLELKLDEAILKSTGRLDRGIPTIKILAAVAPLLGLLGTVTGMIGTFQAITLFGTGDPKLMAGGISQALVTTVLGLVCAIPLILLHSLVSSRSKVITRILEEQSLGLIAKKAEEEGVTV